MAAGTSNTMLGYASSLPSTGGLVLLADASVQQMTAAEFGNSPKASQFKKK